MGHETQPDLTEEEQSIIQSIIGDMSIYSGKSEEDVLARMDALPDHLQSVIRSIVFNTFGVSE